MIKRPYSETKLQNKLHRVFNPNVDISELVWHRDKEDRLIEVVSGRGWMVQLDNQVPIELKPGDRLKIRKETYHRVIRGNTPLKVLITFLD